MKKTTILILALLAAGLSACESIFGVNDSEREKNDQLANPQGFRSELLKKAGSSGAPFTITDVKKVGGTIVEVIVKHPGSCTGKFDVYWDGSVALSYPPQVYLVLRYEGECSDSELTTSTKLSLDMQDFVTHPDFDENWIIHLLNGSVEHSSNDKNVSS